MFISFQKSCLSNTYVGISTISKIPELHLAPPNEAKIMETRSELLTQEIEHNCSSDCLLFILFDCSLEMSIPK